MFQYSLILCAIVLLLVTSQSQTVEFDTNEKLHTEKIPDIDEVQDDMKLRNTELSFLETAVQSCDDTIISDMNAIPQVLDDVLSEQRNLMKQFEKIFPGNKMPEGFLDDPIISMPSGMTLLKRFSAELYSLCSHPEDSIVGEIMCTQLENELFCQHLENKDTVLYKQACREGHSHEEIRDYAIEILDEREDMDVRLRVAIVNRFMQQQMKYYSSYKSFNKLSLDKN